MGSDEDVVVLHERWEDLVLPVGERTSYRVAECFRQRKVSGDDTCVARVSLRSTLVSSFEGRRGHVVATAPDLDLSIAVLLCRLSLVEALEHTVVLLVESPALLYGDPVEIHDVEDLVEGLDGTLEVGGVSLREAEAVLLEDGSCLLCFFDPLFGEVDVGPACEAVLLIPYAFAVTD